jgi:surface antigen
MLAKNMTALLVSLILLAFANNAVGNTLTPPSANGGVQKDYVEPTSMISIFGNLVKLASGSLDAGDRDTHIKTVLFAVSALDTGQEATWHNPKNATAGRIKVVMTKPAQGGFCRVLLTQVEKDGHIRDYHETACKTIDSQFWTFHAR